MDKMIFAGAKRAYVDLEINGYIFAIVICYEGKEYPAKYSKNRNNISVVIPYKFLKETGSFSIKIKIGDKIYESNRVYVLDPALRTKHDTRSNREFVFMHEEDSLSYWEID